MTFSELFGILLNLCAKANPKFIVNTSFSSAEKRTLQLKMNEYKKDKDPLTLTKVAIFYLELISNGNKKVFALSKVAVSQSSLIPPYIRNNIIQKDSEVVFQVTSPAGAGRLCRVPFYPVRDKDAWSSRTLNIDTNSPSRQAFGIDKLGDDPILSIGPFLGNADTPTVGPYALATKKVKFGSYRILGVEIATHSGSRYIGAVSNGAAATGSVTVDGVAVAVASIISLTDASGVTELFKAVDAGAGANEYVVAVTTAATLANLAASILATGIGISTIVADPVINLTQTVSGTGGNQAILITNDPGNSLSSVGFAGGTDMSLSLTDDLSPIAVSIRDLSVYNGNNLLIVDDSESVAIGAFNILDNPRTFQYAYQYPSGNGITPTGQPASPMSGIRKEQQYKFIGLRDQPVIYSNTQVIVNVEAFLNNLPVYNGAYPADTPLPKIPPISFSMNLIVDLLDDTIFGDPSVPSPASRAAANIKLGLQKTTDGFKFMNADLKI